MGFDLMVMSQTRELLSRLPDNKVDKIVDLCAKLRVDKVLEEVGDLDFQGRSLISMVKHPSTLIVMLYFILSWIAARRHLRPQ